MKSRELLFLTRRCSPCVSATGQHSQVLKLSKFLTKAFQKTAGFGHEMKSNIGFLWQLLKAKSLVSAFNFILKLIKSMIERKHQIKHSYISYATTTMKKLKVSHSRVSSA